MPKPIELLSKIERLTNERRAIRELYLKLDPLSDEYAELADEDYDLLNMIYALMAELESAPPSPSKFIAMARSIGLLAFDMERGVEDAVEYYPAIRIVEQIVADAQCVEMPA